VDEPSPPGDRRRSSRWSEIVRSARHHAWYFAIGIGYAAVTWISGRRFPVVFPIVVVFMVPLVVLFEVTRLRWRYRWKGRVGGPLSDREAWRRVGRDLRTGVLAPERLLPALAVLVVLGVFMDAFIAWKMSIPTFRDYVWDRRLADLDAWLHFGVDPWRLTHLVLGARWATRAVDAIYVSWYTVLAIFVMAMAFVPHTPLRSRFLVTYLLVWIVLGTMMAAGFASGGPVYFEHFTGDARFAVLMERLATFDLRATGLQEALLRGFTGESGLLAEGIAAMPSVHVGVAVLFALLVWPAGGWLRWLIVGYAVAIQVGSVHLGWHYAIDGYVAALVTWGLWAVTGWLQGASPSAAAEPRPAP
jgi:hypothetical protein